MTNIELTDEEARLFIKFRKYQTDFNILIEAGFFDFENGCAIVNRGVNRVITNIKIEKSVYKRKSIDK